MPIFDEQSRSCHTVSDLVGDDVMWQRSEGVLTRRLLDGVVVLAPGDHPPVRVTTPGEVLWALLDEPCEFADLVAVWSTLYGISNLAARAEIEPLLAAWYAGGAATKLERSQQTGRNSASE